MADDSLLVVTEIRSALAECKTLSDVLAIREKAEAFRRLLKIQGESLAAQNEMGELTVRAEVMLGESLAAMEKAKGAKGVGKRVRLQRETTLADLGVCKVQSHRWQMMAAAKKLIAKMVKQATEEGKDFTRAMVYREGKRILKGDPTPRVKDDLTRIGELRDYINKLFHNHTGLRSVLPCVLREIADELTGLMDDDDGPSGRNREEAAEAA